MLKETEGERERKGMEERKGKRKSVILMVVVVGGTR